MTGGDGQGGTISTGGGSGVGSVTGGSGSGSTGSGVVSVGGGSGGAASSGTASAGGGSSGGSAGGGSSGGGSGGTALAGGAATGTTAVGQVTTYSNNSQGGAGGSPATTPGLAGVSMMMAAGPVQLGGDMGVAVVPGVDLSGADVRTAPSDTGEIEQALARAAGLDGTNSLEGARIVRPGSDEAPVVMASSTEPYRIVRPGLEGGTFSTGQSLASMGGKARDAGPMRIVRPSGATGAGVSGALLSTAQLAQGGRFVRPGQAADTRPAPVAPQPPVIQVTDVPTPQP